MEHTWQVRVSGRPGVDADVFVRKQKFKVGAPLQFDAEYQGVTSLEQLLGAFGADLCQGLLQRARKRRLEVDSVEAVVEGRLNNPLVYLNVVGESGHPGLECLTARVYVSTLHTDAELQPAWEETLKLSPLVNTLRHCVKMELSFKPAL
ncbi:MAG: OsmC family protein [Planctomycetes bacterium]|nr:OsmC family protein [Planctomycetota bacterium]